MARAEERIVSLSNDDVHYETSSERVTLCALKRLDCDMKERSLQIAQLAEVPEPYRDVDPEHMGNMNTRLLVFGWELCLRSMSATLLDVQEMLLGEIITADGNKVVLAEGLRLGAVHGRHSSTVIRNMKAEFPVDHSAHSSVH